LTVAVPRAKPTPPTTILFVRHGETPTTGRLLPGQTPGLHLSDRGREQVKKTAESIAATGVVSAIYTSPMERTRETAAALEEALALKATVLPGLADADVGEWANRELRALAKLPEWRTVQRYPSGFRFPGGESFTEVTGRAHGAVDRMLREHPGQTVAAVSHADPIRIILAAALGSPIDLFQRLVVAPASTSAVAYSMDGPIVLFMNATADGLPLAKPTPKPKPARATSRRRARE
jgi:probable phosphomutase (TIGR03848 family)